MNHEHLLRRAGPGRVRFKLDENLGPRFADQLRRAGHDAMLFREQGLGGQDDRVLIEV